MELDALARGYTLPASWYADPGVLAREQERVFKHTWQYIGRLQEVDGPGSYFAGRAGDVPIVVVRDREGTLRGFVNVCRHRGAEVVQGSGRRATLQCHYHAWTYELDGSLRSAPRSEREPGFDGADFSLLPIQVDTWGPFVFANPDPEASPLADTLRDLPELVKAAGVEVDALRFHHRGESTLDANWKIVCENFLECYHCAVAHPSFSALIDVSPDAYGLEVSDTFSTQYGPIRERWTSHYNPEGEVERGQFHFLWPNVVINIVPGRANLSIGSILPAGPERTVRFLDYFFVADASEAWIHDLLEFDNQVGVEDRVLVESVQRGLRSGMVDRGRLMPQSERLIADFQRRVATALAD
jgi:choline monooxygenase